MDLIIHKLLDDALTLMADFWQALWHGGPSINRDELPAAIKRGSTGTTHLIV